MRRKLKKNLYKKCMKELLLIKVGNDQRPASDEDIRSTEKDVKRAIRRGAPFMMITHHAIEMEVVQLPDDLVIAMEKRGKA